LYTVGGTVVLFNTIVANDSATFAPDVFGSVALSDHNLIGNTSGSSGFSTATGDLLNVNPDLAPLGNYGGPTQTMPLLPGSPGIGAGANIVLGPKGVPGLVAWYQANGNAGDSAGNNSGVIVGTVGYAPGPVGQAFSFNGNGAVAVADAPSLDLTSRVTLDAWIDPSTLNFANGYGAVVAKSGPGARNYGLYVVSDGSLHLSYFNSSGQNVFFFTTPGLIKPGTWTNVAAVIDTVSGVMQIYVNGQLVAARATSGPMVADTVPLTIGSSDNGAFSFIGQIAEVQVYNSALTQTQIANLYTTSGTGLITDQRGFARLVGSNVDIGATEYQYDLAVTGTAPATTTAGQPVKYTFTVTNNGPDPVAGVTLTDVLPATGTFVSATAPSGWTVSAPAVGRSGTVVVTDTATLAPGANATFTVNLLAPQKGTSGMTLVDTVTDGPTTQDTAPGNNRVSLITKWSPGKPAGVDIHGQPANGVVGAAIGGPITVAVVDQFGNTVTTSNQLVTLSIATGPAGAVLEGTTTVRAVNGVATFTNVSVSVAGTYTLKATGGKLTPDFSNPFTISPQEVTNDLEVRHGRVHRGRGRDVFEQVLTITNTTDRALDGPLGLVLSGLPKGVSVRNPAGIYQGAPFVQLPDDGALAPGQKERITIEFVVTGSHRDRDDIQYRLSALLGL
jgi:uncharacterized repeat protein (TIGR01451 family)